MAADNCTDYIAFIAACQAAYILLSTSLNKDNYRGDRL